MGFLDQEQRLRQQQLAANQAAVEKARLEATEALRLQHEVEEDMSHAPEDYVKISELLDNLPQFDFGEYLSIVSRHSGFRVQPVLYSRMTPNEELLRRCAAKGIEPWVLHRGEGEGAIDSRETHIVHPTQMFCGDDVQPRKGFWGWSSISEPQGPGIGIRFSRFQNTRKIGEDYWHRQCIDKYKAVYVRLMLPNLALVTGKGDVFPVTSLEEFDHKLSKAFEISHTIYSKPYSTSILHTT